MSFSSRELRDALGRFATGICLVTTVDEAGQALAVTVNSFASVSLEPPLILWSVQKNSDLYEVFIKAEHFAVAVLSEAQESHSTAYSLKDGHILRPEHYISASNGAPLIAGALVNFECSLERALDGGDHTILLGRVQRVVEGEKNPPLVFFGGAYRQLK
ncbi:MAG: flavin reductase family protein [Halieaceae bacterium]|jgi:flavin reductase (DIM6/NTAB) family NADH-FMN oxidoreductase RutF|nr:flavin reductase family protein [Halieaceae bacterium]